MATTFRELIAANKRNSVLLVAGFILFTAVVVLVLSFGILYYFHGGANPRLDLGRAVLIGGIATCIAVFLAVLSYYEGDQLVLAASGAHLITHADDPQLFNVVEEMAISAGVPMPKVYLIDDSAPNAFATGRDPEHASIAVTRGLRAKLNREELQGVIAHEMSHIRNFDIRLMLLLAILVGTIVLLCDLFLQMLRWGPGSGSSSRSRSDSKDDGKGGGIVMLVLFIVAIVLAILAPIFAQIIQLAVSRQREYLADATGVQLTRNPLGLAHALRKIDDDPDVLGSANRGTDHLYIANPIKKFEARAQTMFASHPPIKDRIARLEALAHE
ncbi:MAG: M48 family metallopeptidase [Planctomycetes bacterium]|nr:M48 family metallopeptidase [Planctomycetota bacterium]